jgi:predicted metal-binding membrane protein
MGYGRCSMSDAADHDFGHLTPAAAGLGNIFSRPKAVAALCVVVLAGLAWLYLGVLLTGMEGYSGPFGFLQALCGSFDSLNWSVREATLVASMWCAMTLAMMLPSAAPMILTYAEIADTAASKGERIVSPFVLAGGYAAIWICFSVFASFAQLACMRAGLIEPGMKSASGLFSGALLVTAGAYQFSTIKHACLTRCQQPFPFFFANWATTPAGVFRLGLKQGAYCLGCCWAMMLVMFAVGLMNVVWMAVLGIVMTTEKMLSGRTFTHAVGAALIILGAGIAVMTIALISQY